MWDFKQIFCRGEVGSRGPKKQYAANSYRKRQAERFCLMQHVSLDLMNIFYLKAF